MGDIGEKKKRIILVPTEEPVEAPIQEPSPEVVPAAPAPAEPVPA